MADDVKTTPIPVLPVTVIAEPGTPGSPLTTGTPAVTPDHQPNLVVNVVTPIVAIAVRFLNLYLNTVLGLVLAATTTQIIPASDFTHLLLKCAGMSLVGPTIGLIKDMITIFGKLEGKYPLLSGSV
jgi:hypothetical protein